MMNFVRRCTMAGLVMALLTTGQSAAFAISAPQLPAMPAWVPTKGQVALVWAVASWIALQTRGTDYDYKLSDWRTDLDKLMDSYNIFDAESRAAIVELYKKWVIGRKCTLDDTVLHFNQPDGSRLGIKKKKLRCSGFGVVGLFDAYVIQQLEGVIKAINNLQTVSNGYHTGTWGAASK